MKARILILEDEQIIAFDMRVALQDQGYEVAAVCASASEAIQRLNQNSIDLMIVDFKLSGDMNGEEAASAIRTHVKAMVPVIFVSGTTDSAFLERVKNDPCALLVKPFQIEDLISCVESVLSPQLKKD